MAKVETCCGYVPDHQASGVWANIIIRPIIQQEKVVHPIPRISDIIKTKEKKGKGKVKGVIGNTKCPVAQKRVNDTKLIS